MADSPPLPVRGLTQARWLTLPAAHPDAELLRADYRSNMLAVARVIGWAADWETLLSRPTMARIIEMTGLSERTCQRWCRWLERRGLIEVTEPGTTARYRPGVLHAGEPNLAREWRLTDPAGTPSGTDLGNAHHYDAAPTQAHVRGDSPGQMDRRSAPDSLARPSPATPSPDPASPPPAVPPMWPSNRTPHRRAERLAAAESLRRDHPVLRRMSPRALRSALRPWFEAGWTPGDIRYALEHDPDGLPHCHADRVRLPGPWLAARLAPWAGLPPRSQRVADERHQILAEQARRRAGTREPAGYTRGAAMARALLAARLAVVYGTSGPPRTTLPS